MCTYYNLKYSKTATIELPTSNESRNSKSSITTLMEVLHGLLLRVTIYKVMCLNKSNRNLLKYAQNTMFPLYRCLKSQLPQYVPALTSFPCNIAAVICKAHTRIFNYACKLTFHQRD